ncbi:MAG: hypothetical protein U0003_06095, partial [Vampirovibrionales bacterium]
MKYWPLQQRQWGFLSVVLLSILEMSRLLGVAAELLSAGPETAFNSSGMPTQLLEDAELDTDPLVEAKQLAYQGKTRLAKAILEALLAQKQVSGARAIEAHLLLAAIARDNAQVEEARRQLGKALRINPNNPAVMAELGYLYIVSSADGYHPNPTLLAQGDELLTNAERLNPMDSTVLLRRADQARLNVVLNHPYLPDGSTSASTEQWQAVEALYQKAEAAGASYEALAMGRLTTWIALGRFQEAIPQLIYQLDKNPSHAGYRMALARWHAAQQQPTQALEQALMALQSSETVQPEWLTFVAQQYERVGDVANARQFYERVLQESPSHTP